MAQYIADFLNMPYVSTIEAADIKLGMLPTPFCEANSIVAVCNESEGNALILSNPFNLELIYTLKTSLEITNPKIFDSFF